MGRGGCGNTGLRRRNDTIIGTIAMGWFTEKILDESGLLQRSRAALVSVGVTTQAHVYTASSGACRYAALKCQELCNALLTKAIGNYLSTSNKLRYNHR